MEGQRAKQIAFERAQMQPLLRLTHAIGGAR